MSLVPPAAAASMWAMVTKEIEDVMGTDAEVIDVVSVLVSFDEMDLGGDDRINGWVLDDISAILLASDNTVCVFADLFEADVLSVVHDFVGNWVSVVAAVGKAVLFVT